MAAKTMFTASKASRASLDEIVLRSHRRAVRAQDQDVFQSEICPLTWEETNLSEEGKRSIKCRLSSDENPREDLSTERLKNVQGLFQDSVMSAAHLASGADGAGFVLMASEQMARKNKWPCLAKVVSSCVEAKSPAERGQDLWSTAERALQSARWKASDLDVIQVSEASVAQVLGFLNDFPGDAEVVNPNGGHLAYGHAMAAASATDTVMLLHEMNRKKAKKGMVVSDASGGQQMAVCFERVQA
jgi:acetyl-CoA acyltransferase